MINHDPFGLLTSDRHLDPPEWEQVSLDEFDPEEVEFIATYLNGKIICTLSCYGHDECEGREYGQPANLQDWLENLRSAIDDLEQKLGGTR